MVWGIVVLIIEVIICFKAFLTLQYNMNFRKKLTNIPATTSSNIIYIFIPIHESEKQVKKTIKNFTRVTLKIKNVIPIFILDTVTISKIKDTNFLCINKNILIDDTLSSTKTSKLNYALTYIQNINSFNKYKNIFIGVYDSDACPSRKLVKYISTLDLDPTISVLQDIPMYLNQESNSIFLNYYYRFHIRRSLGIEGLNILGSNKRSINYLMGSGMYIKLTDLIGVHGFPNLSDDITLGYKLKLKHKKVFILPNITKVSYVHTFGDLIRQHLRIYFGLFSIFNVLKESSASFTIKIKLLFLSLADALLEVSEFIFLMIFTIINYCNFQTWLIIMSILVAIAYCYEIFYELIVKEYSGYSSRKINFWGPILFYPLLFFYRTIVIILYPFYRTKIDKLFKRNTRKDNTYEKNTSTNR